MGDEDDALALAAQPREDGEQFGDLGRREIGGRLVQDQQFRVAQHRLEDFDPLPAAERQIGDARDGIEIEAEALAGLADARRRSPRARAAVRPPRQPSMTFSTTVIASISMKC